MEFTQIKKWRKSVIFVGPLINPKYHILFYTFSIFFKYSVTDNFCDLWCTQQNKYISSV